MILTYNSLHVSECPEFKVNMYRSHEEKLQFLANVTTTEATIPFASIKRQEIQLITDPKGTDFMPWESSSIISKGKVFFATWSDMDRNQTKVIRDLPIDQNFKTLSRIYGRIGETERYITHDCPRNDTNTKKWQCLVNTDRYIESVQVCDGFNDCRDESDEWMDESDEDPERCKGSNNNMIVISKCVNIAFLVVGYIVSLAYFPITKHKTLLASVNSCTEDANNSNAPADLDPETFKALLDVCIKFEEWNNYKIGVAPTWSDIIDITNTYKSLHERRDFKQIRSIYSCLQGFSWSDSFKHTSMALVEHLIRFEQEELNCKDATDAVDQSVVQLISGNLRMTEFLIESRERNDFIPRMIRNLISKLKIETCNRAVTTITILSVISLYIINTVMPYYDSHLDASLAVALHHIESFFITSESKEEEISFISLTITKYYFYLVNIQSTLFVSILFYANLSVFQQNEKSILFSETNFGRSRAGKIFSFFALVFPYHFMALEYARLKYLTFKQTQWINELWKDLKSKKASDTINKVMEEFRDHHKTLQEILDFQTELQRLIVAFFMVTLLLEGFPQLIVMFSLLAAELRNENGFGKFRSIFENVLEEYIGIPGNVSFILMLGLQFLKIVISLRVIVSNERYGIGSGSVASIIKVLQLVIMVPAKFALITVQLYQAPYVFPLVSVAECTIAYVYCKVTQIKSSVMRDVVPLALTPALYLFTKGSVLRQNERNFKKNFTFLVRFNGAHNVVILHLLNLLLVYTPFKLVLPEVLSNVSNGWENGYVLVLLAYFLSLIPFLGLELAFVKYGRRWKKLQKSRKETIKEENAIDLQVHSSD